MRTVTFCLLSGFSLLFLGGCNEAVVEVGEPAIEVAPLYAIFPQYVADVRNFADSVLAQGTSEDVTYSQDLTWTPSFGGSPYEATFYPAQRVVDDTIMVSSLRYWKWRQTSGYGTSFSDIAYPTQYRDSLQLYYRINIIAPVVVGGISGPTNIPYKGTYAWSMSRSGGDVDSTWVHEWRKSTNQGSSWTNICSNSTSCQMSFSESQYDDFLLRAVATNSGRSDSTSISVTVADPLGGSPLGVYISGSEEVAPHEECEWQAGVTGGWGTITYNWWGALTGSAQTVFGELSESSWLWVEATDADLQKDTASIFIDVDQMYSCEWKQSPPAP